MRTAEEAVDALARTLSSQPGVADVRYDRRWLTRLNGVITFVRSIGVIIVALLVFWFSKKVLREELVPKK